MRGGTAPYVFRQAKHEAVPLLERNLVLMEVVVCADKKVQDLKAVHDERYSPWRARGCGVEGQVNNV